MENRKVVSIVVGRFQVSKLHTGHLHLLSEAKNAGDDLFVFIGSTKTGELTEHDPLPYEARKEMISEYGIPKDHIFEIIDLGNWEKWVKVLDEKINSLKVLNLIPEDAKILICGSRDSVAINYKKYDGTYDVYEIQQFGEFSGTKKREEFSLSYNPIPWTEEKRNVCIWTVNKLKRL